MKWHILLFVLLLVGACWCIDDQPLHDGSAEDNGDGGESTIYNSGNDDLCGTVHECYDAHGQRVIYNDGNVDKFGYSRVYAPCDCSDYGEVGVTVFETYEDALLHLITTLDDASYSAVQKLIASTEDLQHRVSSLESILRDLRSTQADA